MKKIILTLVVLFTFSTVFTGCRDEKSTGEKIEAAAEDTGNAVEDAANEVGNAVEDTAEEVEDEMK